ncbi:MAG TPA: hypothetical protein VJ743_15895 [Albitalea sp.]|nr:hypothetical protein [Albitalea sp.]
MIAAAAARVLPRYHRWPAVLGSLAAVLVVAFASLEVLGWPFLAAPAQRWLSGALRQPVSFAVDGRMPASVSVHLLGRVRIDAPLLTVAAPPWAGPAPTLRARDVVLSIAYADLWRARRGEALRIRSLEAAELDADLQRASDGRRSWPMAGASDENDAVLQWPLFQRLKADSGTLRYRDERLGLDLQARAFAPDAAGAAPRIDAEGRWQGRDLRAALRSQAALAWIDRDPAAERVPVAIEGQLAGAPFGVGARLPDAWGAAQLTTRLLREQGGDARPAR